jgi:antitoxin VapB
MALSIKNPETERLARKLARATGESLTQAVTHALRDRLVRETGRAEDPERMLDAIREIQERVARLPILDTRTDDEIIGYDENGLPT